MQIKFVNYLPNKGHPNYVYYIKSEGKFYGWDIINLRFYNLSTPDFNDVLGLSLTNLQDGQVLTYNATTDLWENKEGAPTIQELSQIQDVYTPTYTNLGVLYRDTNDNLWKIATISDLLGYTPANKAGDTFTGSITATNLSGTNTGDETNATIKTKLGAATSLVDGYLTSTDWNTFNNKQSAISLTTTGSSGAATFSGNVLNIPQYADTNLYNIDGSLTSNRIITLNSLNLTIAGTASSVFFANGNVAIGTTTDAGFTLDVRGVGRFRNQSDLSSILLGGGAASSNNFNRIMPYSTGVPIRFIDSSNAYANIGARAISIGNTYANILAPINGAMIFGNVLIGTTTDSGFKLDVNGTTNITAQGALSTDIAFRVRNSANTGNILQVSGNGNVQVGVGGLSICRADTPNGSLIATITYGTDQTFRFSHSLTASRYIDNTSSNSYIESKFYNGTWQVYGSGSGTNSVFLIKTFSASANSFFLKLQNGSTDLLNLTINGNLLLGTSTDAPSAILNLASTTKGFLPPRMTSAQRTAISTPAVGLIVYQTDETEGVYVNTSTGWKQLLM